MNRNILKLVLFGLLCWSGGSIAVAQTEAAPKAASPATRRTSLQWTEMKGKRTQIFIDLNTRGQSTYRGLVSGFAPTFLIQLPGDGSVDILEYEGSGDDWKWTPVPAHIVLSHPASGIDRVEFDYTPLTPARSLTVVFRSLDNDWSPVASSKVLPWHPS